MQDITIGNLCNPSCEAAEVRSLNEGASRFERNGPGGLFTGGLFMR
jgi:hypothetical protein